MSGQLAVGVSHTCVSPAESGAREVNTTKRPSSLMSNWPALLEVATPAPPAMPL